MSRSPEILVIRLSSLGDVILTIPAIKAMKDATPDARISWLVEGPVAKLLTDQDFVDEVIVFPRSRITRAFKKGDIREAYRAFKSFARELRQKEFDVVIDFHGIIKSAFFALIARADRKIGFDKVLAKECSWLVYKEKVAGKERMHKVERNISLASRMGIRLAPDFELKTSSEARISIDQFFNESGITGPVIAVNPFCSKGSEFKRWDLANYGQLCARVKEATGATIVILWGPGEEQEAATLVNMTEHNAILAPPTDIPQALALLSRTSLYVGGDTGVMHLAALAGVPVVAIFGPTDHLINGPHGEGHVVLRKDLTCSPCRDKKCRTRECIKSISVDEVFKETMAAWDRVRGK